jgi:RNase adaptor protein for sRNA GlmZ degradation
MARDQDEGDRFECAEASGADARDGGTADTASPASIDVRNLREFFRDSLHAALERQKLGVDDHTEHYVVNVLTLFARSEALFDSMPEGRRLKPLALMLAEAGEAPTREERHRTLQRLGDVSLFVAGFLPQGFARRLVDVDYHVAMGGRAYGTLADTCRTGARGRALGTVFAELAGKFQRLVDALNDVSEMAHRHDQRDVLRQYEIWLKTGSPRAHGILRGLGVEPVPVPVGPRRALN